MGIVKDLAVIGAPEVRSGYDMAMRDAERQVVQLLTMPESILQPGDKRWPHPRTPFTVKVMAEGFTAAFRSIQESIMRMFRLDPRVARLERLDALEARQKGNPNPLKRYRYRRYMQWARRRA